MENLMSFEFTELQEIGEDTAAFATDVKELTEQDKYASINERLQKAGALALQLADLLDGIEEDRDGFNEELDGIVDAALEDLPGRATEAIRGSNNETLKGLPGQLNRLSAGRGYATAKRTRMHSLPRGEALRDMAGWIDRTAQADSSVLEYTVQQATKTAAVPQETISDYLGEIRQRHE
jgi:hypothetical protein